MAQLAASRRRHHPWAEQSIVPRLADQEIVSTKAIAARRKRSALPRGRHAAEEFTTMSLRTENRTFVTNKCFAHASRWERRDCRDA
jgi:hypothetical protein